MRTPVRPRYVPPLYQDSAEAGRLILRDGSTAQIRPARAEDRGALDAFFQRLSPESRRQRFFSLSPPRPELIASLCDNSNPSANLTLVVTRTVEGLDRIIATGSYLATKNQTAEVAFAVEDAFHGKGLATLLLERLAILAVQNGFTRFWAVTRADNRTMREVFRAAKGNAPPSGGLISGGFALVDIQGRPSSALPINNRFMSYPTENILLKNQGVFGGVSSKAFMLTFSRAIARKSFVS